MNHEGINICPEPCTKKSVHNTTFNSAMLICYERNGQNIIQLGEEPEKHTGNMMEESPRSVGQTVISGRLVTRAIPTCVQTRHMVTLNDNAFEPLQCMQVWPETSGCHCEVAIRGPMLQLQGNNDGVSPLTLHVVRTSRNYCHLIPPPHELQETQTYCLHCKPLIKSKISNMKPYILHFSLFFFYLIQIKVLLCGDKRFQEHRDRLDHPDRAEDQQRRHTHNSSHCVSPSGADWLIDCSCFLNPLPKKHTKKKNTRAKIGLSSNPVIASLYSECLPSI